MYEIFKDADFSDEFINNFKVVLWNLQSYNRGNKFETDNINQKNVFLF